MSKCCWGCKGSGAVINWQGAPIECPICNDTGGPFYRFTKKQYEAHFRGKR